MWIVPAAPAGQLIQTYVVGAPVIINHNGKSMAEQWRDTVTSVGVKDAEQLSAVCTDGQYLHNHVPEFPAAAWFSLTETFCAVHLGSG